MKIKHLFTYIKFERKHNYSDHFKNHVNNLNNNPTVYRNEVIQ